MTKTPTPRTPVATLKGAAVCAALLITVSAATPALGGTRVGLRSVDGARTTAARYRVHTVKLARGLQWRSIMDAAGPNDVQVLVVTPSRRLRVDLRSAGTILPATKTTTKIAKAGKPLAAINGDFQTAVGRTLHPFLRRGELVHTGEQTGFSFALTKDQRTAFLGRPDFEIRVEDGSVHLPRRIATWNGGQPVLNRMAAFTDAGGNIEVPPDTACSARLASTSGLSWAAGQMGMTVTYTVKQTACGAAIAPVGGVVLSAVQGTRHALWIQSLLAGQRLSITRSLGWAGAYSSIGGMPQLLQGGASVAPLTCTPQSFCDPNPRTAVGATAGCTSHLTPCKIFLVVVDGRRSSSVGMTFPELADLFIWLGAADAVNLDGGGSSAMWVKGRGIVNQPSDGSQRRVPNAVVVTAR